MTNKTYYLISIFIFLISNISYSQIIEKADGLYYNKSESLYTGKYTEFYDNGNKRVEMNIKSGKKHGKIIADMDLMIASIAISNKAILYTNNLKHFNRIEELEIL